MAAQVDSAAALKIKTIFGFALKKETRLPLAALAARGPLGRLVKLRGFCLAFWLFLAATARPPQAIVDAKYRNLAKAMGLPDADAARGTVTHWLDRLEQFGLARRTRYGILLLALDGTDAPYSMPTTGFVAIPAAFFANSWHTALSTAAVAVYLIALAEITKQWRTTGQHGVWSKRGEVIRTDYGIARSTFEKGKAELASYGLIGFTPMSHRDERPPKSVYIMHPEVLALSPAKAREEQAKQAEVIIPIHHEAKAGGIRKYRFRPRAAADIHKALESPVTKRDH